MRVRYEKAIFEGEPYGGLNVLDVGCEPGHFCIKLAELGVNEVVGIDFAEDMIKIAETNAKKAGSENICKFIMGDFLNYEFKSKFDYSLVMGFMDYIKNPHDIVNKIISITINKAVFSFPVDGGILAWQRKLRYKNKCDLYMYDQESIS